MSRRSSLASVTSSLLPFIDMHCVLVDLPHADKRRTQAIKRIRRPDGIAKSAGMVTSASMRVVCVLLCVCTLAQAGKHKKKKPAQSEDLLTAPFQPAAAPAAAPAPAVEPGQRVDSDAIKQALAAYDDLDYAKCVDFLQKALTE